MWIITSSHQHLHKQSSAVFRACKHTAHACTRTAHACTLTAHACTLTAILPRHLTAGGQGQACISPSLWQTCSDLTVIGEMVCNSPQLQGQCVWRKLCTDAQPADVVLQRPNKEIKAAAAAKSVAAEARAAPTPQLCNEPDACCLAAFDAQGQFSEAACLAAGSKVGGRLARHWRRPRALLQPYLCCSIYHQ